MKRIVFCLCLALLMNCVVYGGEIGNQNISYFETRKAVIKEDNSLWMWGYSDVSLLGNGLTNGADNVSVPTKVMDDVKMVSNGNNYTMAIKTDGSLWGWGYNIYGQIGDGTGGMLNDERTNKVEVLQDAAFVSAGHYNTFAIKNDGSLWGWGRNEEGQLGDGTKKPSYSPIKIMEDVMFVTQGKRTAYVVKKDNTLWEIGKNVVKPDDSQVGLDLITPRKIMEDVVKVSEDIFASRLAVLKTDATVWVIQDVTVIKPAMVLTEASDIFAGSVEMFAVKNDGSLWLWGHVNSFGATDMKPKKIAEDVASVSSNFVKVTAVIKKDGSLWEGDASNVSEMKEILRGVKVSDPY